VSCVIDSCHVKLGSGYEVLDLNTEPESCKALILGSLPEGFSETQISALVCEYGEPEHIEASAPPTRSCHALVRFKQSSSALRAAQHLNGQIVDGTNIFACLRRDQLRGPSDNSNTSLKVHWKAPSICAYATFEEACNTLSKLDETVVLGRLLKVTHQLNDRNGHGFSLRVEGLSPLVSMADVLVSSDPNGSLFLTATTFQ
jgi:hypothetical protein